MTEAIGLSRLDHEPHHVKSRLDYIIPKNEELLNNLNLKIDRRINNGYYFHVAAKRKNFIYSPRNKGPAIKKKSKIHPVFKKIVKPSIHKSMKMMKDLRLSTKSKIQIK